MASETPPRIPNDCRTCVLGLLDEIRDIQNAEAFPSQKLPPVDTKALATQRPSLRRLALPLFNDKHDKLQNRKWPDKSVINVQFRNIDQPRYALDKKYHDFAITKVKEHVQKWEACTNLKFNFVAADATNVDIRVAFVTEAEEKMLKEKGIKDFESGSWSIVGTPSRDEKHVSMNLDIVKSCREIDSKENTAWDREWAGRVIQRKILHEFGHAIGFIHEHLREDAPFRVNVGKVLTANGWDASSAHNVSNLWPVKQLDASPFDISSIMIYPFDSDELVPNPDGSKPPEVRWVYQLSKTDQEWAAKIYPKK